MALRKDDVAAWDVHRVGSEMQSRLRELAGIRERNGGTLANLSGDDRDTARRLGGELDVLGARWDEAHEQAGADDRFVKLHAYMNEPDPNRPHPGHGNGGGGQGDEERPIRPVASMWSAMKTAGFELTRNSRVHVPAGTLWGAVTYFGPDTLRPVRIDAPIFAGADRRYVFPALRSDAMGFDETAVDFVRQTGRTLATPALMRRGIDEVTEKPETASAIELAHEPLEQVAHKVSGVPNIAFRQPYIRQVIDADLRLGLAEALDDQAVSEINAAGLTAGGTGSNLATRIRKAITVVEAAGFSPDVVALSPADAEALDLELLALMNSTETLPNWGLSVRVGKSVTTGFVFSSGDFATLHASPIEVAAFEENDGGTNSQLVRAELNSIVTVDQVDAAAALGAAV